MEIRRSTRCRAYDIIMSREEASRHHEFMIDITRNGRGGFITGGSAGPLIKDMRAVPGKSRIVFYLEENLCDEYEAYMRGK